MARRITLGAFAVGALAVALVLAFVVSPFASSAPDGLERVAADEALDTGATAHALEDGPLADYAVSGIDHERLSTGVAGVIGVLVTFAVGTGAFFAIRALRPARPTETAAAQPSQA